MKVSQFLIALNVFFSGFAYAESEYRQLDTHQHGKAELSIAISKQDVMIELHSPAYNILGFEHQPETEQQEQQLLNALTLLKTADKILAIPKSAQCLLKSVAVESPFSDHDHHHHDEDNHKDFTVIYQYQCKHISSVDLNPLFKNLPGFEQLDVQWLYENQQSAQSLDSSNSQIKF